MGAGASWSHLILFMLMTHSGAVVMVLSALHARQQAESTLLGWVGAFILAAAAGSLWVGVTQKLLGNSPL